ELDRVAQSLLGVQQDRVALQRIFSEPERTAIAAAVRWHAGSPPPPFVLREAAAKVADRQQPKRLIETRVGVILADFERLGIARQGLVMAIERLQHEAAIVPGPHMVGSDRERAIISRDRILIATHVEQAYAAVVVRRRIAGRQRQRTVELGEGLLVSSERGQREAAIEQRVRMTGDQRQDLVDGGKRILRTPQREQRIGALMQRIRVAGLELQRFVETLERLLIALERMQHDAEVDPRVRRAGIDLERGGDEPVGFAGLSALRLDRTEKIERVELIGQRLEHAGIDLLRLAQPSLLLQRPRLLQRLSDIWPRAMRHGHRQRSFTGEAKSSARARSCYQLPQFVRRRSIIVAFPLGPRLKGFGPAVIRVRIAKSAVAGNHLRDALFEGSHAPILNK